MSNMILTEKVEALISLVKEKSEQLERLNQELEFTKNELKKASAECVELQSKYDNLKIAKGTVALSSGDISEAKRKITDMMEQIDVCIAKLSDN